MTDLSSLHVERINQAHKRLDDHDGRLQSLETHVAVAAERDRHIQESLTEIKGGISWITRLVLGAIVLGAIAFALKGGFDVSP